jgi:hypothetical protein
MNYSIFFGLSHLSCNNIPVSGVQYSMNSVSDYPTLSWKESFHSKYEGRGGIPPSVYNSIQLKCTISMVIL